MLKNRSQIIPCIVLLFFLLSYADSSNQQLTKVGLNESKLVYNGSLTATLNHKTYNMPVNYKLVNKTFFEFKTDNNAIFDSNGDGVIITAYLKDGKLQMMIIDQDLGYSSVSNIVWHKNNTEISGEAELLLQGTQNTYKLSFKLLSSLF